MAVSSLDPKRPGGLLRRKPLPSSSAKPRQPISRPAPGRLERFDYEYRRNGWSSISSCLSLNSPTALGAGVKVNGFIAPLTTFALCNARACRCRLSQEAERIRVVLDTPSHLTTGPPALSTPPSRRPRRAACSGGSTFHYTPMSTPSGSTWLRIEIVCAQKANVSVSPHRKLCPVLVAEDVRLAVLSEIELRPNQLCGSPPTRPEPKWRAPIPIPRYKESIISVRGDPVPANRKDDADLWGGRVVTRRKRSTTIVKAFVSRSLIFALSAGAVHAADVPSPQPAPPSPGPEAPPHWYVRLGVLGGLDQSWSSLFAQQVAGVVVPGIGLVPVSGFGPQVSLVGRGATYSSVFTASFQAGYFFTPNWSLEVAGAVPLWLTIKITGFSAAPPFSGAVLYKLLPGAICYHRRLPLYAVRRTQPYLGGGIVPSFEFAVQDGFNTGGYFKPTVGLVAQAGADYMFSRNWGSFSTRRSSSSGQQGRRPDSISVRRSVRFPGPPRSRRLSNRGCSQRVSPIAFETV